VVRTAVSAFVLTGAVYWLCVPSALQRLHSYIGQDLRTLSEDERIGFDRLLGCFVPEAKAVGDPPRPQTWNPKDWYDHFRPKPFTFWDAESWYLWRVTNEQGHERLVLFQRMHQWVYPSNPSARIFVMDREGKPLSKTEFPTGWRIAIEDARWLEDGGHGFSCLRVCSAPCINGADITSQYYAFREDTFALARLEDSAGRVAPGCCAPHPTIGPPLPVRTAEQWEAALHSPDRVEVLRTLVWLGSDLFGPPVTIRFEPLDAATLALETRARPGVRAAVEALTRSTDSWVQEAAQQTWEAIRGKKR
jgi:hypothetical protein